MEAVRAVSKIVFIFYLSSLRLAVYCDEYAWCACLYGHVSVCPHEYLRYEEPHIKHLPIFWRDTSLWPWPSLPFFLR